MNQHNLSCTVPVAWVNTCTAFIKGITSYHRTWISGSLSRKQYLWQKRVFSTTKRKHKMCLHIDISTLNLLIVEVKYLFFGAQSISITLDTFQLHLSIEGALASATHGIGTAHLHRTSDGGCLAAGKLRKPTVTQVTKICLTTSWFVHGRLWTMKSSRNQSIHDSW